jgi:hypothetical protein
MRFVVFYDALSIWDYVRMIDGLESMWPAWAPLNLPNLNAFAADRPSPELQSYESLRRLLRKSQGSVTWLGALEVESVPRMIMHLVEHGVLRADPQWTQNRSKNYLRSGPRRIEIAADSPILNLWSNQFTMITRHTVSNNPSASSIIHMA